MTSPKDNHIPPATLPGTPKSFPIPEDKLIELAKKALFEDEVGRKNEDCISPDFKFEFPVIKLNKKEYLDTVRTFDLYGGFPNYTQNAYDWRVDKYEPHRVWFTCRVTGTHSSTLRVFKLKLKPTGINVLGAPECFSMTFNEDGKVTSITGGYVMDNRIGNTDKMGGLFGILAAIGVFIPHPRPGTIGWKIGCVVDGGLNVLRICFNYVTFGLFRQSKLKTA